MTLEAGTKLGRYEILSQLGAGGMGEVYLAFDTQLDRNVALKILPAQVASDSERMRRFVQEAKAAAALNHPSIAHVYEIGELDGTHFIAMEYVEGETLREKIHRERAPLPRLLKWLAQVAEGLAKAHAAGIVHRDLKPDNVMISRDGYAKILDFGLAKLIEPRGVAGGAQSEVATQLLAQHSTPGVVMGTVGYMSPEQAQGRVSEIDQRSDIFSFGCILFEAATGRRAFEGRDAIDSLHKIVHAPTPQIRDFNAGAPGDLQRIVRRCLQKDPERRYQSIKDVAIELEELCEELGAGTAAPSVASSAASQSRASGDASVASYTGSQRAADSESQATLLQTPAADSASGRPARTDSLNAGATATDAAHTTHPSLAAASGERRLLVSFAVCVAVAAVAFFTYKVASRGHASASAFEPGKIERLTGTGNVRNVAVSPDGKFVAYLEDEPGKQSIVVRDVATTSSVQVVAPAEVEYTGLNFSQDGNYVYFSRMEKDGVSVLYSVPKLGGTPKKILAGVDSSVTFSPDGKRLAFVRAPERKDSALVVADADGANERKLASPSAPDVFAPQPPAWSPDGKLIAVRIYHPEANVYYATLAGVSVADGTLTPLTAHRWDEFFGKMSWEPDGGGLLLSAREKSFLFNAAQIWRVSYPSGAARQITEGLTSYKNAGLSADARSLVTVSDDLLAGLWTVPVAQPNAATQVSTTPGTKDGYCGVAWTRDGHVLYAAKQVAKTDIWRMNADGTGQKQLTDSEEVERYLSLPRDDRYVVFDLLRVGGGSVFRADSDGGNLKQLTDGSFDAKPHVSPDGRWVAYTDVNSHLWKVSIDGGQPVQ
ncbi:MAG: protein kinase, partial [Acidobacteriota bacterium]|nr:protein kinase [Acidobacteriota bacterium]